MHENHHAVKNDNEKSRRKESSKGLAMSYRETSGTATSKRELRRSEDGEEKEEWEKNPKEFLIPMKKTRSMVKTLLFQNGSDE